jgi:hypothetical protein
MEESPLHPFELHNYATLTLGGLDISINKAVVMMWVVVGLISILMIMAGSARRLVPGKLQSLAEMMVDFIRGIILDTMGKDGMNRIDSGVLHRHQSDRGYGGVCLHGLCPQPCHGLPVTWRKVSWYSRTSGHTGLAVAFDDPD